jgi:hypothetical protein
MMGSAPHHPRCFGGMEIQWMGSTPHRLNHIIVKSCSANGERSVLPLPIVIKKVVLQIGIAPLISSNWILASCMFFSLSLSPWFETSWNSTFNPYLALTFCITS